jgi:hypothetical protein
MMSAPWPDNVFGYGGTMERRAPSGSRRQTPGMALRSVDDGAKRMVSGAMRVSKHPERRPMIERGLRVPREHRRQVAGSEGCERQLTEAWRQRQCDSKAASAFSCWFLQPHYLLTSHRSATRLL